MKQPAPANLRRLAEEWDDLRRWDRAELGRSLRRLGWTYGEIRKLIPVPKGTLSYWCRNIRLSDEQIEAIKARTKEGRRGVPVDTQRKRRLEIEEIKLHAREFALTRLEDSLWVAGTVLYWGEGGKKQRQLEMANSDPRALKLFIDWTRTYHRRDAEFSLALNLHADNDEPRARRFWSKELDLPLAWFQKTYIKPDGTGHRKNHLFHGVCKVRMRRSTDAWIRTLVWVDVVATAFTAATAEQ